MPTTKIADLPRDEECRDPEHNPPTMMVWKDGIYIHECPTCHHKQRFEVRNPKM
jgi:hypothetical protein